jgi:polyhydroxyalkanoate synthesis regulator phasin
MTTTTPTLSTMTAEFLDAYLSGSKALSSSQDQLEALALAWVEQAQTMRHDGEKVFESMIEQVKTQTAEAVRLTEENFASATQLVPAWDMMTMGDLKRQVSELSARVDALSRK